MLHNSGGFGPEGNPSNTNLSKKTQKMSAPPNLGHNIENLSEIAQQLRTTSERYDIPVHGSYNYELSSYNPNLGTFSAYPNRRLPPDVFNSNTARYHDLNWQSSLATVATHMHSMPFQNMPHFAPPFDAPRISTDHRSQSLANSHVPEHRNMDNYQNMYNRNKDNFSHYNQSFQTQESHKIDGTKQKKLEDSVKILENLITTSSNEDNGPQINNYNEQPTYLGKCDNQGKNMLSELLRGQGIQTTRYNSPSKIEINEKTEEINSKYKYQQIDPVEHLKNNENTSLNKDFTEFDKQTTEREDNSAHKEAPHHDQHSALNEPESTKTDTNLLGNNDIPQTKEEEITIANESSTNDKEEESISHPDDANGDGDDSTNEHEETFPAKAELQINEYNVNKIDIDATEDTKDSKVNEIDFSAIFLRDSNKLSYKDVKKGTVVNFVSSVEKATACIRKGTKKSSKCFYECQYCNYYFQHPKRFLIHVKWHTFGLVNKKQEEVARQQQLEKQHCKSAKTQQCDFCEKQFKTLNSLTNHKHRFHSSEQLECPDCGALVSGVAGLRAHRSAEHPELWVCPTCRRPCSNKYTLAKHMRTHLEKHISCSQCDKLFATNTQLKDHMRMHERIARGAIYKCSYCDKSFYQTYNLHAHEKTHSNERPFGCEICNTKFSTNSSLKRHLRVSHNAAKPHACPECGRCFAERRTLVGHMSKTHPGSGALGAKDDRKIKTKSHYRKGKRGRKNKKTEDTSDGQESDMDTEYM